MKKFILCICFGLSVQLLSSCAAQQEDPQAPLAERADTLTWQNGTAETEIVAIPTPRQHVDPDREYFVLSSDSSRVTQEGSTVWVMVRGPLANGCQRHEYYDSVAQGTTLYLTFWGSRPTDSTVVCTEQTQGYDREVRIENSQYTKFSIIQPDGHTRSYGLMTNQISQK
jgi:hypothetical protein